MGKTLTVGIPAYKDFMAALDLGLRLRTSGHVGPILISVNESPEIPREILDSAHQSAIELHVHAVDLGLYGNFRWLAERCTTKWFMWLALDDEIPTPLTEIELDGFDSTLIYCAAEMVDSSGVKGSSIVSDPIDRNNVFNPHPCAIFGIWDASWLRENFPRRDFDWLDTYLLTRAFLASEGVVKVEGLRVIGNSPKQPHRVNGKFHVSLNWAVRSTLLLRFRLDSMSNLQSYFTGLRNRIVFSFQEWFRHVRRQ